MPLLEVAKLTASDRSGVNNVIELAKRQVTGMAAINKAISLQKSPLTPREREVALLAKERQSVKEIAGALFISESTVKSILKAVYSKLDVHSKSQLSEMDF